VASPEYYLIICMHLFTPAFHLITDICGAEHEFVDEDVENRKRYYYKLEDIDVLCISAMQEPVSATPGLIYIIIGG
jgi:hypothetical protein